MKSKMHFLQLKSTEIGFQNPLISGINTSLDLGEVCLLIGNNGVGKTTLIKSILGQIPLLKGDIFINQKNSKTLSNKEIAEQIAIVFSKSEIPTNFTTWDLVAFGKYIHYPYYFELNNIDKQYVTEIIESLHLTEFQNTLLLKLSDGNLQKALIGRALAQNSEMIILDEPTTHLDENNKLMILNLLRKIAKTQNKLILFSSHDWRLAKEFSDKIWWINDKKLHAGLAEDILLQNDLLTKPKLFHFNSKYISPQIFAPELEKEMLYSALQKNIEKDLSSLKIIFDKGFWLIDGHNFDQKTKSIAELILLIQMLY